MAFFERFLKPASNSTPPASTAASPRSGSRDAATVANRRPPTPAPLVDPHDRPTFVTGLGPKPPAPPADGDGVPRLEILAEADPAPRATVVNPQRLQRVLDSERNFAAIAEEPGARDLSLLARSFPSLEEAPGTEPWDPRRLVAWLNDPTRTDQAWWSGCFVLGVAEPDTDWTSFGLRRAGRFDVFRAAGAWDARHREAFAAAFASLEPDRL